MKFTSLCLTAKALVLFMVLGQLFRSGSVASDVHPKQSVPIENKSNNSKPAVVQVKAHLSKMDGESLDRILSSTNVYKAILFYASWCPFSRNAQPKFDALATMYPHKLSM
ncbi:hypothetical protein L6452_22797 [Arctium lappa]|uniref:Uncharacterized protein n=1 Tax=Arctium lappa TaxID=4217 RepID=A0ACB9B558_ARCLA|nr:hypothetical protein L6452_22797 [Arctium lappa]